MKKQTLGLTFGLIIILTLFRIGLTETTEESISSSPPNNTNNDEYISGNKINCTNYSRNEKRRVLSQNSDMYADENQQDLYIFEEYNRGSSDMKDSDTMKNILNINCSKFDSWFNFTGSIIKKLGRQFYNSSFINCLHLEGTLMEYIESGAFDGLPNLEYLNLANNFLPNFFSFDSHDNLKVLVFTNQRYFNLDEEDNVKQELQILGKYPELRYLDLSGNKISSIILLDNPQYNSNSTIDIPFPKLNFLDLSSNVMDAFNNYHIIFNNSVTHLYMSNNILYHVDIHTYTNLVKLILDGNNIRGIVDFYNIDFESELTGLWIGNMSKLEDLSLSDNNISHINDQIFENMRNLITLDLSTNKLDNITLEEMNSLQKIYLDNNRFFSFFMKYPLPNVTILSLGYNKLTEIVSNFVKMPILTKLYLNNNFIDVIHKDAFSGLQLLEHLSLQNNRLNHLPKDWCQNLRNLHYLDLSRNLFKFIESMELSQSLPKIQVHFVSNLFTYINSSTLEHLPINATIYLISEKQRNG